MSCEHTTQTYFRCTTDCVFNIFVARRTAHGPENNKHQCTERGYLQLIVQDHQLPAIQQQQRAHLARMGDPTTVRLS